MWELDHLHSSSSRRDRKVVRRAYQRDTLLLLFMSLSLLFSRNQASLVESGDTQKSGVPTHQTGLAGFLFFFCLWFLAEVQKPQSAEGVAE